MLFQQTTTSQVLTNQSEVFSPQFLAVQRPDDGQGGRVVIVIVDHFIKQSHTIQVLSEVNEHESVFAGQTQVARREDVVAPQLATADAAPQGTDASRVKKVP